MFLVATVVKAVDGGASDDEMEDNNVEATINNGRNTTTPLKDPHPPWTLVVVPPQHGPSRHDRTRQRYPSQELHSASSKASTDTMVGDAVAELSPHCSLAGHGGQI